MSGREAILSRLRATLRQDEATEAGRRETVAARLAQAPVGLVPARGQLPGRERVALFQRMAEAVQATVEHVGTAEEVPGAVARLLRTRNLPAAIRMGGDPRLAAMPWGPEGTLELRHGPSDGNDIATLSHALAGIAETGTLVLHSGTDNPTTLNFLPELHVVAVAAADIAGDMEAVWRIVRERFGKGAMPRSVNLITGPSRSADIEQKLILGAHGPRALHILVIGAEQ